MEKLENVLLKKKHILVLIDPKPEDSPELNYIKQNFCGRIVGSPEDVELNKLDGVFVYLCGDISKMHYLTALKNHFIVQDLSYGYDENTTCLIPTGQIPININNVGVFFRNFFEDKPYFDMIVNEHNFQGLTESNKPGIAFRKGIYLSNVVETDEGTRFNLLRCSTNFEGPTDNFRDTDLSIINQVNNMTKHFFEQEVKLNHVLAQIYENKIIDTGTKKLERKAKIKAHSDKTKDIPRNGLIAFCTFYKMEKYKNVKQSKVDPFDHLYKGKQSIFTRLHFKLKDDVEDQTLQKEFSLTLYPNSVFVIPLSTNRLYTHEIKPPYLSIEQFPLRMGYVMRCSNVEAVHKDNQTFIDEDGTHIELEQITADDVSHLKSIYYKENLTSDPVEYDKIYFSMNSGDYKKPLI